MPVNVPGPDPSIVLLSEITGSEEVFQQIPLSLTGMPPSLVMVPPLTAPLWDISDTAVVVRTGLSADKVVKLISDPYSVILSRLIYDLT